MNDSVLQIENLTLWYRVYRGVLKVLDNVSLEVGHGQRIGLVGETGCGKTSSMKAVMRILPSQAILKRGEIRFEGRNVYSMTRQELRRFRTRGVAMIFQDPTAALNPVFTIGDQMASVIEETMRGGDHRGRIGRVNSDEVREISISALRETGLPDAERLLQSYPFQLSGGMRQRVCIAMALATERKLLIADEPTTSLDVTIQDQVLRLIRGIVEKKQMSLILITHSLGVARQMTDWVYVMYAGRIVEYGKTLSVFEKPCHPYTIGLLDSIPKLTGGGFAKGIEGRIPDYAEPPDGCRFHPRCRFKMAVCEKAVPGVSSVGAEHYVFCHKYKHLQ